MSTTWRPPVDKIGKYEVKHRLTAHSAEADIWIGQGPDSETVALKIYRVPPDNAPISVQHPHVLTASERIPVMDTVCDVTPFRESGNITTLRAHFEGNEAACIEAFNQLAEGLRYLHEQGIFHRGPAL